MFIVKRDVGQGLVIGRKFTVRILEVRKGAVRIGIDAPRDVPVHRAEIVARIAADAEETHRRGTPDR